MDIIKSLIDLGTSVLSLTAALIALKVTRDDKKK